MLRAKGKNLCCSKGLAQLGVGRLKRDPEWKDLASTFLVILTGVEKAELSAEHYSVTEMRWEREVGFPPVLRSPSSQKRKGNQPQSTGLN